MRSQDSLYKSFSINIFFQNLWASFHYFFNERKSESWIDSKGKFIWIDNEVVINFGQHRGKSLPDMVKNEPGFLNWMLTRDFLPDAKNIVSDALNGKFPQK